MAAAKAVEDVFGVQPDLTREGCSIPITLTFQEALNKNVLLLPMGRSDDVSMVKKKIRKPGKKSQYSNVNLIEILAFFINRELILSTKN